MDLHIFRQCNNVRELGGYPTLDGKHVKSGLFYRSGALGAFDQKEIEALNQLDLKAIFDFRSEAEAERLPDPDVPGARYFHISAITDEDGNEIDLSPEGMENATAEQFFSDAYQEKFLLNFYGRMPFSPAYRLLFQKIRENSVPVLFHCSAGKDRTGIAAMLILLALNVDEETIMKDYLLTNTYRKEYIDELLEEKKDVIAKYPNAYAVYESFEGVRPESLTCSMNEIKRRCGTYQNYFKQYLHMDQEDLLDFRRRFTE